MVLILISLKKNKVNSLVVPKRRNAEKILIAENFNFLKYKNTQILLLIIIKKYFRKKFPHF